VAVSMFLGLGDVTAQSWS